MHLLIPFAAWPDPACQQSLPTLQLPVLTQLLTSLQASPLQQQAPGELQLAHEHILAQSLGLPTPAPWAALAAQQLGLATHDQVWGFLHPCHWEIGQAQVTLHNPEQLQLQDDEARALLAAMQPYFAEDGLSLHYERADRWLVSGEPLRGVQGASLERMIGRNVAPWLPSAPWLRRLQNEMQMLLYTHPINDARLARRLQPVNSFCLSAIGALPDARSAGGAEPLMPLDLRGPALRQDWSSWQAAWQQLDATQCRALLEVLQQGKPVRLSLCSENTAQTWSSPGPRSVLRRLIAPWRRPKPSAILATLCN